MHARHTRSTAMVAALATLAMAFAGCSDAVKRDDASVARNSGDPTSDPAASPAGDPETDAAQTTSGAAIVGEFPNGDLEPGRYALPPIGPLDAPLAVVDIPAGYGSWEAFVEADEPVELEDPLMLGLWVITGVYMNPCAQSHKVPARSVDATVAALFHQRFMLRTRPRDIELAGYRGLYMEVWTPKDLDYSTCDDAELNLWEGRPDGGYWTRMPGMANKLWILDVDGQPMVIDLAVPPSATRSQIDAMTHIVRSATFESSDG